jgi:hypothetical protein
MTPVVRSILNLFSLTSYFFINNKCIERYQYAKLISISENSLRYAKLISTSENSLRYRIDLSIKSYFPALSFYAENTYAARQNNRIIQSPGRRRKRNAWHVATEWKGNKFKQTHCRLHSTWHANTVSQTHNVFAPFTHYKIYEDEANSRKQRDTNENDIQLWQNGNRLPA